MALKPCKSCKHQVDMKAKTCPNCGVSDPGVTALQKLLGFALLIVIIFVVVKACSGGGEKTSSVENSKSVEGVAVKTLGLTPKQYAERANRLFSSFKTPYTVDGGAVESGEVNDILNAKLGPYLSLVGTVSKRTGELQEVTLIGAGDGSAKSGVDIMMISSAALAAATPDADHKAVLSKMSSMLDGAPEIFGDVKLSIKKTENVGIWFFASPI